jgi:fimbrial isopeptide formation D2 family protein
MSPGGLGRNILMAAVLPKLTLTQVQTNPASGTNPLPGSLVTYAITVGTDPSATADASNSDLVLTLGSNLTLQGNVTVSDPNGGTETVTTTGTGFNVSFGQNILRTGQPITITYTAKVSATATQGSTVNPSADITYQNASPDELVYATNNVAQSNGKGIFYQYDVTTGALTTFGTPTYQQDSVAFDGKGNLIFTGQPTAGSATWGLSSYNLTTGVTTLLVNGQGQYDLAIYGSKVYYNGTANGHKALYVYDLNAQTNNVVVQNTGTSGFAGLAFDTTGRLFANYGATASGYASSGVGSVMEINPTTGATIKQSANLGSTIDGIVYDSFTKSIFVTTSASGQNPNLWQLDESLNVLKTYNIDNGASLDGMSSDGKGNLFIADYHKSIVLLDLIHGTQTQVASTPQIDDTIPTVAAPVFDTSVTTTTTITAVGSLSGTVFLDNNDDGIKNGVDNAVSGVSVQLLNSSGVAISGKVATTDSNGNYTFTGLVAGTYGVQFTAPAGDGYSPVGTSTTLPDSSVNATGKIASIAVSAGANTPNQNAGVYVPVSLSGNVFLDQNANGIKETGDSNMGGQTVTLLTGAGASTGLSTTTDTSGNYSFTGLKPGSYEVKVTPAAGDSFSAQQAVTNAVDSIVNPANGTTAPVTLSSGQSAVNQNAGEYAPASLTAHVYTDSNADASQVAGEPNLSGVTVQLLNANGTPTGTTGTTDINGNVSFANLTPGTYEIGVVTPTGDVVTQATNLNTPITLASGGTANAIEGVYVPVSVSGNVFLDQNANGIKETGDTNLGGQTVTLLTGAGGSTGLTTTTDASGNYSFTGLKPGSYEVKVTPAAGDSFSTQQTVTNAVDSIVNPANGTTAPVTLSSGQSAPNQNAGEYAPASLTAHVYTDSNADASQVAGEPNLSGVTVQLLNANGTPTGTTGTTDINGNVSFTNLTPGTYEIGVVTPTGDVVTQATSLNTPITLASGGTANAIEGVYVPVSVSGNVFVDQNANGIKETGDTNLGGQTVTLLTGAGGSTGLSTTTDASGNYSFTGLKPGSYEVKVTPAAGDSFSAQQAVTNAVDSIVNPANGTTAPVTLSSGQSAPNQNAGEYAPAGLTAHVYTDSNADASQVAGEPNLSGVTVQLLNANGTPTGTTGTTDVNGNVSFANLTPGTYEIGVVTPTGDVVTQATNLNTPITLASGGTANAIEGVYVPVSVSGNVFLDQNANGIKETGDAIMAGQTVTLLTGAGASTGLSTTTDASGNYSFTGLKPGSYEVKVSPATGDSFSAQQAVTNAVDSIVNPANGTTAPVTLSSGQSAPNQNAGEYAPASLTAHVYTDSNADASQVAGEPNLSGVTVQLLNANGTPTGTTGTTDVNGNVSFANLTPGTYEIGVVTPTGDVVTQATNLNTPITLVSGGTANAIEGVYVPVSVSGNVFLDQNANGIKETGDTNLGGQTVTLLTGAGGSTGLSTTTDASGNYSFTGLKPGSYEVKVTPDTGDSFSAQQTVTNAVDSIVNPANGTTAPVTLSSGQSAVNQNAGEYKPASLSGTVFADYNDNGVENAADTPIKDIEVDLYKDGVNTGLKTTTDASGNYSFTNLVPGSYSVQVVKPAADSFSPVGSSTTLPESIVNGLGKTAPQTLSSGQTLTGQNAGLFLPPPALTIHKQASISSGQAGDIVTYTVTVAEPAGNTSPAFNISIADLLAASETLVKGSETIKGGSGGIDTIVENGTGFTITAPQLVAGDQPIVVTYQAKLADSVYNNQAITNTATVGYDNAASGGLHYTGSDSQTIDAHLKDQFLKSVGNSGGAVIRGETITFELDATLGLGTQHLVLSDVLPNGLTAVSAQVISEGQVITSVPLNTVASPSGNGFYIDFGNVVAPGGSTNAVIKVLVTATVDPNVVIGTTITNTATLTSTTPGGALQDTINSSAQVMVINPGKITGMVFLDGNCNGIYHVGDPGMAGVTVRLLDKDGNPTGIVTTTDSYGQYSFNKLIPGQYEVQVVAPQGTAYSDAKNAGTNPLLDSDVNPSTGITDVFVVASGQTVAGVNAGLEFNGYFGGVSPTEIGNGTYLTNSGNNVIVGDGNNNVALGAGGGNIVVLDGHGLTSTVEIQGTGDDIVTSCGPLVAQTQTSGSGYIFAGNGGSSTLNGGLGNAYLMGAGSNDLIFGGAGHNVIIGGGSTGVVTTAGGVVTGYTDGDRLIAGGIDTVFLYEKGDGVVKLDGGLRAQDSLKISGYAAGQAQLIKVGGLDALWFGGNDLIVFYGQSPYVGGVSAQVSFTGLPGSPDTVVVFGAEGKPSIVTSGGVAPVAPAPLVPAVPTPGGGAPTPLPGAPSSQTINLSGYNQVFDYTKTQTSSKVDTTVQGSQGFATITVGDGDNTVTAAGYGNVIKAGSGTNTINAGDTLQKVTVGDGSNTITASGYANVIVAGNGVNVIKAGAGGETVTVGNGANTITATGSGNVIVAGNGGDIINAGDNQNIVTVGNGTNTVIANGYNNLITVGDGHNTILAGAGGDTVDLGAGSDTVTLSGWSNLLIGGLGLASVSGGTNNVFRIEGVGSTGGLDVMDFGTTHNDVLDLSKVLSGITLTPGNIDGYVSVTGAGTDTVVSVDANGMGSFSGHVVATLHGAGASSLADLQAQSAIKLS